MTCAAAFKTCLVIITLIVQKNTHGKVWELFCQTSDFEADDWTTIVTTALSITVTCYFDHCHNCGKCHKILGNHYCGYLARRTTWPNGLAIAKLNTMI